jgi:methylamine--corrinoid protein Co-methyltransferase
MVEKYNIVYAPEQAVPADDDLADRLCQAGVDLFLELGVYCRDTGRLKTSRGTR